MRKKKAFFFKLREFIRIQKGMFSEMLGEFCSSLSTINRNGKAPFPFHCHSDTKPTNLCLQKRKKEMKKKEKKG